MLRQKECDNWVGIIGFIILIIIVLGAAFYLLTLFARAGQAGRVIPGFPVEAVALGLVFAVGVGITARRRRK